MHIRTNVKAGGTSYNHNESQVRGLKVRSSVKAGGVKLNHNEQAARRRALGGKP